MVSLVATMADHWDGGHMGGGAWMWFGWSLMLLVLVAVGAAVAVLLARGARRDPAREPTERARAIAMERYARGEIDAAELSDIEARLR